MITRGQALDIGCKAAILNWPKPGHPSWTWARTTPGRSCPWMVTVGDSKGPLVRILVEDDGETTIALV